MLEPKKTKYRKQHRGHRRGKATRGNTVAFGDYGLIAVEPAWITARQIEASRVAISHSMKKGGKFSLIADQENGEVVFKLSDTGQGIPAEIKDHLLHCVSEMIYRGKDLFEAVNMSKKAIYELYRCSSSIKDFIVDNMFEQFGQVSNNEPINNDKYISFLTSFMDPRLDEILDFLFIDKGRKKFIKSEMLNEFVEVYYKNNIVK